MKLYRIAPQQCLEIYTGLGASYQDGARWNSPGHPVLYFALSPATALLEMANYLPSPRLVPKTYRLGVYEVPDKIAMDVLSSEELPGDWAIYPYPASTQAIGDKWLGSGSALGLQVPSTAVPVGLEKIALLNPNHPDINQINLMETISELYNKRSFSGI